MALHAADGAGRRTEVNRMRERALPAVFTAAIEAAKQRGRDVTAVQEAVNLYMDGSAESSAGRPSTRNLVWTLRRNLGAQLEQAIATASVGVEAAVLACMTWDLTSTDGPYTAKEREILTAPWRHTDLPL